jgi:hypothetical protein
VNIEGGNLCQTCDQLIPGCAVCDTTNNPGDELSVKIGYNKFISNKNASFVMCSVPGPGLIKVKINGKMVLRQCN